MAKKVDFYAEYDLLQNKVEGYSRQVERILDTFANESTALAVESGYEGKKYFRIDDYPDTKKLFEQLQRQSANDIRHVIINGATALWADSNFLNDKFAQSVLGDKADLDEYKRYFNNNAGARDAFLKRQRNGLNLSQRIWRIQDEFKEGFEGAITVAIQEGTSAAQLSRSIRQYLREPDKLFKAVNDPITGRFVRNPEYYKYHPGTGIYRSSYRNAMRVAATEINMAYRQSDQLRWKQMDFIVGYEIKRSGHPYPCPICEALKGRYPKDFVWTGWHPWCYDEKSEVLTDSGWKFFKDVCYCDKILSLNPKTRSVEWVDIALYISRHHSGDMVHFHNNSLDCLVTPEHEMVYLNKCDGSIRKKQAVEFRKGHGAFYRSCEWVSPDVESIRIGNLSLYFDLFCEFMGYWLSDGSTIRNSQICIAQMDGDTNKDKIVSCIERLGFKVSTSKDKINFYSRDLCAYLKQFGLCSDKFVPYEIKNASKRQIQIFLDAFISCDGYTRTSKSFVGSRGTLCVPKNPEKVYYTTSQKTASDIGELILKVGKRPSYHITPTKGKVSHFKNGDYASNFDEITIRECVSITASEFKKDIVHYDGTVYDVTLSKNHIMYIRRNGKCFWGSNCRCRAIPILKTEEEMNRDDERILSGKDPLSSSVNSVKGTPEGYNQWILQNLGRMEAARTKGTLPYFIKDNPMYSGLYNVLLYGVRRAERSFGQISSRIAKQTGSTVTPTNIKSNTRIVEKAINDYGGDASAVMDVLRNTFIAKESAHNAIMDKINREFSVFRTKPQISSQNPLGYSGIIVNARTLAGVPVEIQVNSAAMIYGKEVDAKRILGSDLFNRIREASGLEHGLGHKWYEKWRSIERDGDMLLKSKIEKSSIEYYDKLRRLNL